MTRSDKETSDALNRIFKISSGKKKRDRKMARSVNRIKYIGISVAFALVLGVVFDRNLWKLYNVGGDLPGALEGMFAILLSLTFAIIGVYLIVHVLHPHFGKKPLPDSLANIKDEVAAEDMSREELIEFVRELESEDDKIGEYLDTMGVKSDVWATLATALAAFFFGMYGYMTSFTIGYDASPNILSVSLCFMFIIFANVYMILKTMKVIWDV